MDYGTKRTGLAVTDLCQMIASSLETVLTHELMVYLQKYFEKEKVETMRASDGIGQATPQIGKSLKIFVVDTA